MKQVPFILLTIFFAVLFSGLTQAAMQDQLNQPGMDDAMDESMKNEKKPQLEFGLNEEQIRELQSLLGQQGLFSGSVNGKIDFETRVALAQFQKLEGLVVTGNPDPDTLRALASSTEKQEFFGLAPEYGEKSQPKEGK